MKIKIKLLKWSAGGPIAMLHKDTAEKIGVNLRDRISIKTSSKEIDTIVDTIGSLIKKNEIAVSSEIKDRLKLRQGQNVEVNLALAPQSLEFIKKKLEGKRLSKKEIFEIVYDIVDNSLSESEVALFVSSMYRSGMIMRETIHLIEAILETGDKLGLKRKLIVDKHSIGGVAGRTSPIVVSICAAAGLTMPKTSSRAITSPAGTADVIELLTKIEFDMKKIRKIVQETNACLVWGGALEMVPADSKIIKIEKELKLDPESQLLASIMAKKLSVGSNCILIHIPYGNSAKVNKKKANKLRRKFNRLGKHFNKKLKCILTPNDGPIGNGIGPILELIDVINVLNRKDKCYKLEERSVQLAGELLELSGKVKRGKGEELALRILDSGKAFEKFKQIINAQGGKIQFSKLKPAKFIANICVKKGGKIKEIDNKQVNSLARIAGCPSDKFAGVYLYFHAGDRIKKGDKLLTIYAESKSKLNEAIRFYKNHSILKMG